MPRLEEERDYDDRSSSSREGDRHPDDLGSGGGSPPKIAAQGSDVDERDTTSYSRDRYTLEGEDKEEDESDEFDEDDGGGGGGGAAADDDGDRDGARGKREGGGGQRRPLSAGDGAVASTPSYVQDAPSSSSKTSSSSPPRAPRHPPKELEESKTDSSSSSSSSSAERASRIWASFQSSPLFVAPVSGLKTDLVQCVVIRDRAGNGFMLPSYTLFFQGQDTPAMVALKQGRNTTSNYHIFDMTRGIRSKQLSKKSGNYMGKLRSNYNKTESVLYNNDKDKLEVLSIRFERPGLFDQMKEGSQPRKLRILLPAIDASNRSSPIASGGRGSGELRSEIYSRYSSGSSSSFHELETKDPVFENGNYRLNFHGRVTIPSVKNYQLTPRDDIKCVACQFGRVGDDRFHLDFKEPLNAFQAFAIALAQFSL